MSVTVTWFVALFGAGLALVITPAVMIDGARVAALRAGRQADLERIAALEQAMSNLANITASALETIADDIRWADSELGEP